jgi:hypothetical protein
MSSFDFLLCRHISFEQREDFCNDRTLMTLRAFAQSFVSIARNVFDVKRRHLPLAIFANELLGRNRDAATSQRGVQLLKFLDPKLPVFALPRGDDVFFEEAGDFSSDGRAVAFGLLSKRLIGL